MLIVSFVLVWSVSKNTQTVQRLAEQSLISTATTLASTIERIITEDSLANLKDKLRDLLSDRSIAFVMILDKSGRIIFHSNTDLQGSVLEGFNQGKGLLDLNMTGSKSTLASGVGVYEFNYIIHLKNAEVMLLKVALYTLSSDKILQDAEGLKLSIVAVLVLLWVCVAGLLVVLFKHIALIKKHTEEEQWVALGRMSALIAHEIRNAIGSIKGFAQWLDEQTTKEDPKKHVLALIIKGTLKVEHLVNDLLIYGRHETYTLESIVLKDIVNEAIEDCAIASTAKVYVKIPDDLTVKADRQKLLRVLINVLENAKQAFAQGEVSDAVISIEAVADKKRVHLSIKDNAVGLTKEALKRAFDLFYTTKPKGIGLGLAYCKKVIDAMGAKITISNNPDGRGATVSIVLPLLSISHANK